MKVKGKQICGCVFLFVLLVGLCGCAGSRPPLEGVWEKMESGSQVSENAIVKILADGHFAFGKQVADGATVWSGGGYYDYVDGKYLETVTYHSIPTLVGMTIEFDCDITDGEWLHEAEFEVRGEKFHIDEVWHRPEAPPANH